MSVPAPIRRKLGLGPGAVLEWDAEGDQVVVHRVGRFSFADVQQALFPEPPRRRFLAELKGTFDRDLAGLDGAERLD